MERGLVMGWEPTNPGTRLRNAVVSAVNAGTATVDMDGGSHIGVPVYGSAEVGDRVLVAVQDRGMVVLGALGGAGSQGPPGPAGPSAVSADEGNISILGSDSLIYTPHIPFNPVTIDMVGPPRFPNFAQLAARWPSPPRGAVAIVDGRHYQYGTWGWFMPYEAFRAAVQFTGSAGAYALSHTWREDYMAVLAHIDRDTVEWLLANGYKVPATVWSTASANGQEVGFTFVQTGSGADCGALSLMVACHVMRWDAPLDATTPVPKPPTGGGGGTPPPVAAQSVVNTPAWNSWQSYKGTGAVNTAAGQKLMYGTYSSTNGNQRSVVVFDPPTFTGPLAAVGAARITGGTLTFTNLHTFANSGGRVLVSPFAGTAVPATLGAIPGGGFAVDVPKSGSVTVELPVPLAKSFGSGTGGLVFSDAGNYGYADPRTVQATIRTTA